MRKEALVTLFVLCMGCSTEPGQTTAIGAATGGVLGAGLGAIVGNQVGDPAVGMLLGTAAGSAAGAAVGNSIEAEEEEIEEREERLARQDQLIRAHREEIESLRQQQSDSGGMPSSYRSTTPSSTTLYPSSSPSRDREPSIVERSLEEKPLYPSSNVPPSGVSERPSPESVARVIEHPISPRSESREIALPQAQGRSRPSLPQRELTRGEEKEAMARANPAKYNPEAVKKAAIEEKEHASIQPQSTTHSSTGAKTSPSSIFTHEKVEVAPDPVPEVASSQSKEESPLTAKKNAATSETTQRKEELKEERGLEEKKSSTGKSVSQAGLSSECVQAEEEQVKAENSSEVADKLFHLRRALRLCPSSPKYHVELGDLYLSLKRNSDAQFEFQEAIKIDPNNREAQKKLESIKK